MKIIVIGTRGFPDAQGGIEKHCQNLYPRLVAMGCEVIVLSRAPYTGKSSYFYKGVSVIPLPCPKHKCLEALVHTWRAIWKAKDLGCDLLHIHAIGPSLLSPMARWLGLKVVITHHGPDYERQKWKFWGKWVLRLGERWGVSHAHAIIAVSQTIGQLVREKFGRSVTVIPNGVFIKKPLSEEGTLERFGLKSERYILAVGRFVPEKGFQDLVACYHYLALEGVQEWKLVIVGDADHEDEFSRSLEQRASHMRGVVLTGRQGGSALETLYSQAALFVLPSYHEGLPIVLLEALSYGRSCLASDIPANREVPLAQDRYFTPGHITGMASKIKQFLKKADTIEDRQLRIQAVRTNYDWGRIARMTLSVYRECLGIPDEPAEGTMRFEKHEEMTMPSL
jgi:glycosyltransferase involved in cell wall biosynthesis